MPIFSATLLNISERANRLLEQASEFLGIPLPDHPALVLVAAVLALWLVRRWSQRGRYASYTKRGERRLYERYRRGEISKAAYEEVRAKLIYGNLPVDPVEPLRPPANSPKPGPRHRKRRD